MASDLDDFFPSKYLRAAEVLQPTSVTIVKVYPEDVINSRGQGDETRTVPVVEFDETDKPMILNKTNFKTICKIAGSENIKDWSGTVVELYVVEVQAFGETTDAIRIRAPKKTPEKTQEPKPEKTAEGESPAANVSIIDEVFGNADK